MANMTNGFRNPLRWLAGGGVALAAATVVVASAAPSSAQAVLKPLTDAKSLAAGKAIFESPASMCTTCHRPDLGGLVGPNLTDADWLHGCGATDIVKSIRTGYPDKGMVPFGGGKKLSDAELLQLASYILSKRGSNPAAPKAKDPVRDKACKS